MHFRHAALCSLLITACSVPFETCTDGTAAACVGPDLAWDGGACCADLATSCVAGPQEGCPGLWTGTDCCFEDNYVCAGADDPRNRPCPTSGASLCAGSPAEGCDGYFSPDAGCCVFVPVAPVSDEDEFR